MTSHRDSELSEKSYLKYKAKQKIIQKNYLRTIKIKPNEQQLLTSVATNNIENVQRLLDSGVSPNSRDNNGRSALHLAASRGYADIVMILLKKGANPNLQDIIENTPLHLAACNSNLQIITLLINGGADIQLLDMQGRNPLQLAESKLQILRVSWKSGAVEMKQIRSQAQEIVDMMISLWINRQSTMWGQHRHDVYDLESMKATLKTAPEEQVDDQMSKLLLELQQFSMK